MVKHASLCTEFLPLCDYVPFNEPRFHALPFDVVDRVEAASEHKFDVKINTERKNARVVEFITEFPVSLDRP